jgi:hypothetical protein
VACSAQCPKEVGVFGLPGCDEASVGEDDVETEELVKTEAVNAIQGAETTSNAGTGDSNALPKGGCLNSVSIVLGDSLLEVQRRRWYLFVSQLPRVLQRLQ